MRDGRNTTWELLIFHLEQTVFSFGCYGFKNEVGIFLSGCFLVLFRSKEKQSKAVDPVVI